MCLHIDVVTFNRAPYPRPPYPLTSIAMWPRLCMKKEGGLLDVNTNIIAIHHWKGRWASTVPKDLPSAVYTQGGFTNILVISAWQDCKCRSITPPLNFSTTGEDKGKVRERCKEVSFVRVHYHAHPSHRCLCTICRRFVWVLTGPRVCVSTAPAQSTCSGGRDVIGGEKCQRDRAVNQSCNELSFGLVG